MDRSSDHDSLRAYLEATNPDALAGLDTESAGLDKGSHNRESRRVHQLLRTDERIVQSPEQAEALTDESVPVDVVVHMGCHAIRTPHIIDATMDLLETLGYRTVPLGGFNNCCGILDAAQGDLESAEQVDANRFRNVAAFDPDYMITECTSCHATTETLSIGYRDPDFELLSLMELLYRRRDDVVDLVEVTDEATVTFHDHHGSYGWMPPEQHEYARDFFAALPGVDTVEMEHSKEEYRPCNFGKDPAAYGVDDLSRAVWREADAAGADVLVNFWHACERELVRYEHEFPLATKNYTSFVAERLGFEYENRTKRYKTWGAKGQIDRILDDARPVYTANGLSDADAREIATTVYGRG